MKPHSGNKYKVIGMMSGTSLDGLDLVAVEFQQNPEKWNFRIIEAETIAYSEDWENRLRSSTELSGEKLIQLHTDYGRFLGKEINRFIKNTGFIPEIIASHGHTVFHQPENHFTFQAGSGADIAAETGITTIADFRTGDVALGGQGAPLVPVGDRLLFSQYESCLNLGGFANISFEKEGKRVAFDICPVNFILNYLALQEGLPFDKDGELSKKGNVNKQLLNQLNNLPFYKQKPPKSLGKEWMDTQFFPVIKESGLSVQDKLRTAYEHIAIQIAHSTPEGGKMLVTGGGAFNTFLIDRIKKHSPAEIFIPEKMIVDYKEALIFAFLGLLRQMGEINCYASVTGAIRDSSSGVVFPGV
ncbi:MAG TPA: anhydro-N-acetylmuramic acid kinase [Tangfeifania sp.]|nr:anhydro-N-acetylmuramic acid kinase [Tangfeifania sp.]